MALQPLDFEKPILELQRRLEEIREHSDRHDVDLDSEVEAMEAKINATRREIYENLTAWQRVQIARHVQRPLALDYIERCFTEWVELHGDRLYADDKAMPCGLAKLGDHVCVVLTHQKGRNTKENVMRNFGCAHPEGYRKALRLMRMAEKFNLPVVVFIDTPGAFPGIGAEERGQAEAIARNIREMFTVQVPIVCVVIGEGASGGALGVGVGDAILMLENSWYCVISPEGCAGILWKTPTMAQAAAEQLKLTPTDLLELGIADEIITEPDGGAHRNPKATFENTAEALEKRLAPLCEMDKDQLLDRRYKKYRYMGRFIDTSVEE
jgi:acetyl-CoA carboxylase carboxyl transferase subunit alpha